MSDIHGLIPHQAGYYYITLEEDYVLMFLADAERWREQATDTPENAKKYAARKAHAVAKAYISSVLEQLSDKQFKQGIPEHKIWVYVSFPEIEARIHGGVKIRVLKDAMKEMDEDGWVSKRPNPDRRWRTKVYQMNFREYRKQLNALPKRVGLIDSADMHDTTPNQGHSADMHDSSAKMHDDDANLHEVSADMHPRITNRDNTDVTQNNKDTIVATSVPEDRNAPAATIHDLQKWKEESGKHKAIKIGEVNNDRRHSSDTTMPMADLSRNERPVEASPGEEESTTQRRASSDSQVDIGNEETVPRMEAVKPAQQTIPAEPPADAAQRTALPQGGAVQASIPKRPRGKVTQATLKSPEELAIDERCRALQQRINDWRGYDLKGESKGKIINEHKSIRTLVETYTDEQIEQIYLYLFNRHWRWSKPDSRYNIGAYVILSESKGVMMELKAPKQNGKPTSKPDAYGNDYSLTALLARQQKAM